jgi:UDP-glucose 4-epimerase
VTGGAGFIGSHLVDWLVAGDNHVVVVDDFSIGREQNIRQHLENPQVQVRPSSICDLEEMLHAAEGIEVVFHLACCCLRCSRRHPLRSHAINAIGTANVCQAALEKKVERLLYVSSAEVYGTAVYSPIDEAHPLLPTSIYGATKAAGELTARSYFQAYGMQTTIARLYNTYGPREPSEGLRAEVIPKFVMRVLAGQSPIIRGTGRQTCYFTYVDDIVRGLVLAAECDDLVGECVNLGRGQAVSIAELSELILQKLGRPDLRPVYADADRALDPPRMLADFSKAQRRLGFLADVDIETGIDRYIAWVRQQDVDLQSWLDQDDMAEGC